MDIMNSQLPLTQEELALAAADHPRHTEGRFGIFAIYWMQP
jgi:hypothetical protein